MSVPVKGSLRPVAAARVCCALAGATVDLDGPACSPRTMCLPGLLVGAAFDSGDVCRVPRTGERRTKPEPHGPYLLVCSWLDPPADPLAYR